MGSDNAFSDALGGIDPRCHDVPVLFQQHWCRAELTLLSAVRAQRGSLSDTQYNTLKTSLDHFNQAGYVESLLEKIIQHTSVDRAFSDQFLHLIQAVLNGVLAAHHLQAQPSGKDSLPDEAVQALTNCFRHYHEAWDLYTPTIENYPDHAASKTESDQVTRFLNLFSRSITDPKKTEWWTHSN